MNGPLDTHYGKHGVPDDQDTFLALQKNLVRQFEAVFPHALLPRTVVVIPSLSLDRKELEKIEGAHHYEERLLCLLMLLRLPRTRIIYVTSQPIAATVIDYYLSLLPGVPMSHARSRLCMLTCHDASMVPLTQKILDRPRLLSSIRDELSGQEYAHMTCFNATTLERSLALALGIPIYAADPALNHYGTKSGSREIFKEAGIDVPPGFENIRDRQDIFDAIAELKGLDPQLRKVVIKLNDGFSGEGNAVFSLEDCPNDNSAGAWVRKNLPRSIRFEAKTETWEAFIAKFGSMGGIVETFVEGKNKQSPSAQCRIDPLGNAVPISTHDQVLGGPSGQVFLGCTFPAVPDYRLEIQLAGMRVAEILKDRGVVGRFGVDFISVPQQNGSWKHYAIEINLRKGGTTHPFLMLQFLIDGFYDEDTGRYYTPSLKERFYYASDNLKQESYKGLLPADLIDIAVYHDLHFHGATQQGVVFHLIGALSEYGKLGVLCIGDSPTKARELYDHTVEVLDAETRDD
ncbi:MAG: carboxylate-amine ligase [Rhodothermales bacterium]|nr:carboxylate-amine ligase [Rhodothermales bacterium]